MIFIQVSHANPPEYMFAVWVELLHQTKDLGFYCSPTTCASQFLQQHHILCNYFDFLNPFYTAGKKV